MGDVPMERETPVAAPVRQAARVAGAEVAAGLGPAGLLALQGRAGNRVVGRVLARAGRRVLARAPSVSDEVFRVAQALAKSSPPDAALVKDAVAVAGRALAEARRVKGTPGSTSDQVEEAYREVNRVTSALIANGAENAAIDFAKTADAPVKHGVIVALRGHESGVAGQQSFIAKAGRLAGVTIPAAGAGQSPAAWLEAQTTNAGQTFKKLEEQGVTPLSGETASLSLALAASLLKHYFTISPTDVKPDPGGKVSGLKVGAGSQLEVDCDVWAAYGARLLRAAGWPTVGFLALVPGESTGRDAHAVALAKRTTSQGTTYAAVSDFMIKEFTAADDDAAREPLLRHALEIYADKGEPSAWKAYYVAAPAGAFDLKLTDPEKHGIAPYKTRP
jgi:hypothetical protein